MKRNDLVRVIFFCVALCSLFLLMACGGAARQFENQTLPTAVAQVLATADQASALATPLSTRANNPTRAPTNVRSKPKNNFPTIARAELPKQAQQTLSLIARGGPFPYRQDGQVFQNREGILPKKNKGYYHEYTVETPGSEDRGARRIVTGDDGEMYYTDDHYDSFKLVVDD